MADDELSRARDEARRARDEALRLRNEARDLERRLREEAKSSKQSERHEPDSSGSAARAEQAFNIEGVRDVSVDQTAGHLTVRMCEGDEVPGVLTTSPKGPPQLEVRREGDRLVIELHMQKGWLFRRRQGPTTVVRLWPGLSDVRANLGYGDFQVRDVSCERLRIDVGAGTLTGFATDADLHADVGAGKMTLNSHRGVAVCNTGTGDVLLDLAEVRPGDYRVDVGMGRAEVRIAPDQQVFIKTSSGIGKSRNEYPGGPETSPARMRLNTGIGEVVVRSRDAAGDSPKGAGMRPQRAQRPAAPGRPRRFEAEELRVLQMLEQGRISSQDAADLIAALQGAAPRASEEDENGQAPGPFA
jgi:hypothetical protein